MSDGVSTVFDNDPKFELPPIWTWTTIDAISRVIRGSSPRPAGDKRYFGGDAVPWITVGSLTADNKVYLEGTSEYLTEEGRAKSRYVEPDTFLLTNSGATLGVPKITRIGGCINDGSVALLDIDYPLKTYLYYYLTRLTARLRRLNQGAAQPNLNTGIVKSIPVPLAPTNEQRRIVDKIEELFSDLDAGVAALKRAKANLKRYRAAVLKAAVEGKLTEKWRDKHPDTEPASKLLTRILTERRQKWEADQLAKFAAAGKEPPKSWREKYVEPRPPDSAGLPELPETWSWASVQQAGSVQLGRQRSPQHHNGPHMRPYLRVANVFEDRIDLDDVMEMNFTPQEFESFRLSYGDILLNEGQSMELVGRPAMYRDELPGACFTNSLVRFRVYDGVDTNYALKVFLAYLKNGRFKKIATITVNIAHLGAGRFSEIEFPLPPMAEQAAIIEEVDRHFSLIAATEKAVNASLARATSLRQSILKQAFEGKLVPQDPQDEPALVLLTRLHEAVQLPKVKAEKPLSKTRKLPSDVFLTRASVVSYTVRRLASQPSFGRTQLEKTVHLAQCHLGIELGFIFERYHAGPFDSDIYKLEAIAKKKEWFTTKNRPKYGVTYCPGAKIDQMCDYAAGYLDSKQIALDRLLDHIAGMNTDEAELFATAYAAWNDLLIDGRPHDESAIIAEVHGWHQQKKKFSPKMIRSKLKWMRQQGYVPTGQGQRTRIVEKATKSRRKHATG